MITTSEDLKPLLDKMQFISKRLARSSPRSLQVEHGHPIHHMQEEWRRASMYLLFGQFCNVQGYLQNGLRNQATFHGQVVERYDGTVQLSLTLRAV